MRVEGATNTRKSFLAGIIDPVITPSSKISTLQDVLHASRHISAALRKTDVFKGIETYVDRPRDVLAEDGAVDLVFRTKEKGRWYVSSATELGNNEGSAVCYSHLSSFPPVNCAFRMPQRVYETYLVAQRPSRPICPWVQRPSARSGVH